MKRITIRLVDTLGTKLKSMAQEKGISMNALIVQMCWDFINKWGEVKSFVFNKKIRLRL